MVRDHQHPITVLGAGSWGTALALVLARNGQEVRLWSWKKDHVDERREQRTSNRYLPHYPFPKKLHFSSNLKSSLDNVMDILIVVPSFAFQEVVIRIKPYLDSNTRIAWGTKGLAVTGYLLHQVVEMELGYLPMAVVSGPSLATEVVANLPTAIAVASNSAEFSKDLTKRLHSAYFRVYQNDDMIGMELCGSVKNILAIATGISDGLALGANARAALITRGLAEMGRLIYVMGGKQETLTGLAGLGDLVLTCTDNQSRNRRFGLALGKGVDLKIAEQAIEGAIEGLYNTDQVYKLAKKHAVEMPISHQVYRILHENLDPRQAARELLERPQKTEH
ncbi:NAD(P)H-dependent glycerol-3-phosphate dehydrogenase [Coxiella endosymbiont of Amblyomma nuttalli]|uniref:NAD(P)H-dependent glycerol-3-phosphate dehydrogenase n=1 Tax=Coxiella endosymbiont of Amblyomma nuttalli TaxID=2749996 RepID=UPI001BA70202|nr:NAD(P)H-dependent glycerol-3-phosphate dehydrogenase [Coxiella endosymbiont of Amblyomma nuttalli]QTS83643.1 Glycerol-3-phosphate dehydrogenase [NAD(P)+] [Coxiella endosymbiont of Amblyomma nuttalli]